MLVNARECSPVRMCKIVTHNPLVGGSNPSGPTKYLSETREVQTVRADPAGPLN